jgi:hypothetical protein
MKNTSGMLFLLSTFSAFAAPSEERCMVTYQNYSEVRRVCGTVTELEDGKTRVSAIYLKNNYFGEIKSPVTATGYTGYRADLRQTICKGLAQSRKPLEVTTFDRLQDLPAMYDGEYVVYVRGGTNLGYLHGRESGFKPVLDTVICKD